MSSKKQPKIGIAFGGGGAKGLSQIGVLSVFEKYNIRIDSIAGTSAGSIIGAATALGKTSSEILEAAKNGVATKKMTKIQNFGFFSESLIKDKVINKGIKEMVGEDTTFEDVKIPFIATAVDLESGEEVVLNKGKLWEAARASSAIPLVISPYFLDGRYLVDGGLLNNVPADHLRKQDLDIVIAIELGGMTSRQFISGIVWERYYRKPKTFEYYPSFFSRWKMNTTLMTHVLLRSLDILRERELQLRYKIAHPDIVVKPKLEGISLMDFSKYEESIDAGIVAAEKIMPDLLKLIEQKKEEFVSRERQSSVENSSKE